MSVKTKTATIASEVFATDIKELDDWLHTLSDEVLPKQPYIVSVPTDVPWRSGTRQLSKWYAGTPFTKEEERLQYLSFIPFQKEYRGDENLLVSEGGWSDDNGGILRGDLEPPPRPQSSNPGQRKKISLDAYKNKARGTSEEAPSTMERAHATMRKSDESLKPKHSLPPKPVENGLSKDHATANKKRFREDAESDSTKGSRRDRSPRPEKKARTSPSSVPSQKQQSGSADRARSPARTDSTFPSLESPTLPPELDDLMIPPLESPTLPPLLEKLLASKPVKPFPNGGLQHKRTESVASAHTNHDSDLSPAPRVRIRNADSPLLKPDSHITPKSTPAKGSTPSITKKSQIDSTKPREQSSTRVPEPSKPPAIKEKDFTKDRDNDRISAPKKLTVVLRYGKKNRKRVEQLLRFAPRPKKPIFNSITVLPFSSQKKEPQDKVEKELSPRPEKRQKLLDTDGSYARKTPASVSASDKPRTPTTQPFASPSQQSKSAFSTPKKELKSSAMQRVQSTDALADARTPQAISRHNTPLGHERQGQSSTATNKSSPPPTQGSVATAASPDSSATRRAWRALHPKYHDLGRKLKHEMQALNAKRPSSETSEAKLSAVMAVEALLCFILGISCLDRANPAAAVDNGWRSTLPYWEFVRVHTKAFPDLFGLTLHLGALIRNNVHRVDMERLARDPLPSEANNVGGSSAPTPGSDGTTKTSTEEEKYRKNYLNFKTELVSNYRDLSNLWNDASRRLSSQRMEKRFPTTWARRVLSVDRERDRTITPSDSLNGDYCFPIDASTTSLEGVRLGRRMLKEWCKIEDVKWTPQMEL